MTTTGSRQPFLFPDPKPVLGSPALQYLLQDSFLPLDGMLVVFRLNSEYIGFLAGNQLHVSVLLVISKKKKQNAIRQDVFWTAGVILAGRQHNAQGGLAFSPGASLCLGYLPPHPGCKKPGTQGKLVNTLQISSHLELLPRVTRPTALNGFMHPHPPILKEECRETGALGFYTSLTQL